MIVVSVNVSEPQLIRWRGRTVRSSIFKRPTTDRVYVGRLGLDGDEVSDPSVHGGEGLAVYAYPVEHLDWWRRQLPGVEVGPGLFGENLTLQGLTERDVAVGDVLEVGETLLRVTEPRTPCFKLSMRVGVGDVVPKMIASGRAGWFLEVVQTGRIAAGDHVALHPASEPRLSISRLLSLVRSPTPADEADLRQFAEDERVPADWREKLAARLSSPGRTRSGEGQRVVSVEQETPDVKSVTFEAADIAGVLRPGQFVTIETRDAGRRSYSVSKVDQGTVRISVLRTGGAGPEFVHGLKVGDRVELTGPFGTFCIHPGASTRPLLLVGGGIGITPMLSMAFGEAAAGSRRVHVVYSVREPQDAGLLDELRTWSDAKARTLQLHATRPTGELEQPWRHGRPDWRSVLDKLGTSDVDVFVCGPPAMLETVPVALRELGVDQVRIRVERFAAQPVALTDIIVPPKGYAVRIGSHETRWTSIDQTLLSIAEAAGAPIPSACRTGDCGTCLTRLLSGKVRYVSAIEMPLDDDECLPCVAIPVGPVELDANA